MTILKDGQVSTETSQNPTIVYEKRNNREEKPNQNKKNDKEKHKKDELHTSYIPKSSFPSYFRSQYSIPVHQERCAYRRDDGDV